MNCILAVSSAQNREFHLVRNKVRGRGHDIHLFDIESFPQRIQAGVAYIRGNTGLPELTLDLGNGIVRGGDVKFLWIHRFPVLNVQSKSLSLIERLHIERECSYFLASLPYLLPNAYCYRHPLELIRACLKPLQIVNALKAGLLVPSTVIGNSEDAARLLLDASTAVALKPAHAVGVPPTQFQHYIPFYEEGVVKTLGKDTRVPWDAVRDSVLTVEKELHASNTWCFTTAESSEALATDLTMIRNSPVILQEFVKKAFDVRVTIVDHDLFACRIHSQADESTSLDFRTAGYMSKMKHEPIELSSDLRNRLLTFMRLMEIDFGSLDLVETTDGEFYFLEVNPDGGWLWTEELAGLQISDSVADWILRKL
jgi:hypothetical protein